jgi:Fur family transcriptional regulator, ferric uptake regulator
MVRQTRQRDAIRSSLIDAGRPLSINEVFNVARKKVAGLGIATVYRNLKALQAVGQAAQVEIPGQPPRWETAPLKHHHHFLCRKCNKLYEVVSCPEDLNRLLPKGYIMENHELLLYGQCNLCAQKQD